MKAKVTFLLILAAAGCLAAGRSAQGAHGIATGELHWTRSSVCEHPHYPGLFLQFYLTDGCGNELFLYARLSTGDVGCTIWAEGTLVEEGWCRILDVSDFTICAADDPHAAARDW